MGIIVKLWLLCKCELSIVGTWPGFPGGTSGEEPSCQRRTHERCGFDPWVRKIPWKRKWQLIPIFLPGKSHGQRSLPGMKSRTLLKQLSTHLTILNYFPLVLLFMALDIFIFVCMLSCVQLFAVLWTVACQAPLSMGLPRQEYGSGLPFPSPGDLPHPGIELVSPAFGRQILYHILLPL